MEKNDTVKNVQPNGTFEWNGKMFYKYEIEFENGDVGEYNSVSENQNHFMKGNTLDYIFDQSNPRFPKIKPVYNFKASPSRDGNFSNAQKAQRGDDVQKMIVKQSCLKAAVESLNGNAKAIDILETANIFVDWVMEDKMPGTKAKKKSKKETTDLPF